jgi:Phosphoribosyl transferase/TRSP domain C terminus to PRTase_2
LAVRPSVMAKTHLALAALLPHDLARPLVCIGMAETATALGQGVFEAFAAQAESAGLLFLTTTRYPLAGIEKISFEEVHSHAPTHFLHLPPDQIRREQFTEAKTLVLIDDEVSTGQTLRALANTCQALMPRLEQVILLTLADFLGENRQPLLASMPNASRIAALASGGFDFYPQPEWTAVLPKSGGNGQHHAPPSSARLGALPEEEYQRVEQQLANFWDKSQPLAYALEQSGFDVLYAASTRSPILSFGPIHQRVEFLDNYGEQTPNYLYNLLDHYQRRIIMCFETVMLEPEMLPGGYGIETMML